MQWTRLLARVTRTFVATLIFKWTYRVGNISIYVAIYMVVLEVTQVMIPYEETREIL